MDHSSSHNQTIAAEKYFLCQEKLSRKIEGCKDSILAGVKSCTRRRICTHLPPFLFESTEILCIYLNIYYY